MFRYAMPSSFAETVTVEQWVAELEHYARVVAKARLRKARVMRAALDGGWSRLHAAGVDSDQRMTAAIDRVNAGLPEVYRVGFVDTVTGAAVGVTRDVTKR